MELLTEKTGILRIIYSSTLKLFHTRKQQIEIRDTKKYNIGESKENADTGKTVLLKF